MTGVPPSASASIMAAACEPVKPSVPTAVIRSFQPVGTMTVYFRFVPSTSAKLALEVE